MNSHANLSSLFSPGIPSNLGTSSEYKAFYLIKKDMELQHVKQQKQNYNTFTAIET